MNENISIEKRGGNEMGPFGCIVGKSMGVGFELILL
jgi:hypothetical protein